MLLAFFFLPLLLIGFRHKLGYQTGRISGYLGIIEVTVEQWNFGINFTVRIDMSADIPSYVTCTCVVLTLALELWKTFGPFWRSPKSQGQDDGLQVGTIAPNSSSFVTDTWALMQRWGNGPDRICLRWGSLSIVIEFSEKPFSRPDSSDYSNETSDCRFADGPAAEDGGLGAQTTSREEEVGDATLQIWGERLCPSDG